MESDLRSIGQIARASGLTVSALRFYDGAKVLVPAVVDPATGYRWYAERQLGPARLVASLRRVGMPLAQIAEVLARWPDQQAVRLLLDAHLRRLEAGLTDARRELSRVQNLLDKEETTMTRTTVSVPAAELAAALAAVSFAIGRDPELPMLNGVLFDLGGGHLRLVATDRYRMALAGVSVDPADGPEIAALAPAEFIHRLRELLAGADAADTPEGSASEADDPAGARRIALELSGDGLRADIGGQTVAAEPLPYDFPDYRRLLPDGERTGAHRVSVDTAALRAAVTAASTTAVVRPQDGVSCEVCVLAVAPEGALTLLTADPFGDGEPTGDRVGVNRQFLLEALDAGGPGQLVLELDGPIRPLVVRRSDDERVFSILMPVRVDPTAR